MSDHSQVAHPAVSGGADLDAALPATAAQREVWVAQNVDPSSPVYNIGLVVEVDGTIDVERAAMVATLIRLTGDWDGALAIFAYLTGNIKFATYLQIPFVIGAGELIIICGAIIGAGLGFLWFNAYPAQVFMGDVGALSLGAVLGTIAVIVRQEIVLFVMCGVFVMETVSVMLQVASFKLTGKRIFRMAPIHHHFELKGWPETRVVARFWIISFMLVLVGLATLKLR